MIRHAFIIKRERGMASQSPTPSCLSDFKLCEHGHEAVAAAPNTGVNTITGEGLAEVLKGASVVVDVSNSPSWDDAEVLKFFETSTRNLLTGEAAQA
jgi:hypothetical protein